MSDELPFNLSVYAVLDALYRVDKGTAKDIASRIKIHLLPPHIQLVYHPTSYLADIVLKMLIKEGLVKEEKVKKFLRVKTYYSLTDEGKKVLSIHGRYFEYFNRYIQKLSEEPFTPL
ncbi:MAG: MarR family winged helix-turn-helix transcriptional regulator [Candidatus Aenigmatarchaeota archaeon]